MKLYPSLNFRFSLHLDYWYLYQILETISEIYVRIFVSILMLRYLCYEKNKNQHSILANPVNRKIFIHKAYQEWLSTTKLELWSFIICSLMIFIFGGYSLYPMLYLLKENSVFIHNKHQENITNNYGSMLVTSIHH